MATIANAIHDSDGVPPGLDLSLVGKVGRITFTGKFYANQNKMSRLVQPVRIIFASKEIYVALDFISKNIYVVDRQKNLSLGCRMTAHFKED